MLDVNYLAVVGATVVAFVFSSVWYVALTSSAAAPQARPPIWMMPSSWFGPLFSPWSSRDLPRSANCGLDGCRTACIVDVARIPRHPSVGLRHL